MLRWIRWHCLAHRGTGFEIRSLVVWGQARYYPANTKHLYNSCTTSAQRLQILCKCVAFLFFSASFEYLCYGLRPLFNLSVRESTLDDIRHQILKSKVGSRAERVNPYSAELFLYKPWRLKGVFFQFKIIINVLVSSFWFDWIPALRVYDHYK